MNTHVGGLADLSYFVCTTGGGQIAFERRGAIGFAAE